MDDRAIRRDLETGATSSSNKTRLYERLYRLAEQVEGKPLPTAIIPGIRLESPKIPRELC